MIRPQQQQLRVASPPPKEEVAFDDLTELVPAFVIITMMVFTYNIANGLTAGLVPTRS